VAILIAPAVAERLGPCLQSLDDAGFETEQASAKVRAKGVADDDEDYELPVYAERIPVRIVLGRPEPCPRLLDGVERPASLRGYSEGVLLEDALRDANFAHYAGG
jgi:hypothetical protein